MAQKKTKIDFQQEINDKYGEGYTVISSEGGVRGTMVIQHVCGNKWDCSPRTINNTKRTSIYLCPKCAIKYNNEIKAEKAKKLAMSKWLSKLTLANGIELQDYEHSKTGNRNLIFYCIKCNNTFSYNCKRVPKEVKCKHCSVVEELISSLPKDLDIIRITKTKDTKIRTYITVRHNCPNCNYAEFTTRIDVFTSSEPRCYICERMEREPVSKPVRDLSNYFDSNGINYRREVVLPDCVNPSTGFPLRFDFEVETSSGLKYIEYDGEQHFMQVEGWGSLESNKYRDQIKNEYCKRNNIALLRVPYTELPNIYDIVDEFISVKP